LLGSDSEVALSTIGRKETNGSWVVPSVGDQIIVSADDENMTNVFWLRTDDVGGPTGPTGPVGATGPIGSTSLGLPTGSITSFAGISAPTGWLLCFGQTLSRTTYSDLFAVLSTTYNTGGEAGTDFRLPDLRGRVIAGQDDMGGISANRLTGQSGGVDGDVMGGTGGLETHTLTSAQMPTHTHTQNSHNHTQDSHNHTQNAHSHFLGPGQSFGMSGTNFGGSNDSGFATFAVAVQWINQGTYQGAYVATSETATNIANTATNQATTATNQDTGGGGAHNNIQPTIVLNYIIKI
jgi:microcystin-dependent protein